MYVECMLVDNKKLLFGELIKSRPFHGTKQCRDFVNNDFKILDVPPGDWYALTMNRKDWTRYEVHSGRCSGVTDMDTQCLRKYAMYHWGFHCT